MPAFLQRHDNSNLRSDIHRTTMTPEKPQASLRAVALHRMNQVVYRVPYHTARIVDPRLDSVKVTNWTAVPLRHSFEFWDPMLLHCQIVLGFMTIKALTEVHDQPNDVVDSMQSTLAPALEGSRETAKKCYLGEVTFCILRDSLTEENRVVFKELINVGEEDEDRRAPLSHHVHSEFPINIFSIADDIGEHKVGNFVAAYKELRLEDIPESKTPRESSS